MPKARILLAEDTVVGRVVATQILERAGFSVLAVGDGRAVLEALQASDFDLVIMDCQMPGMDGFEATRAIRGSQARTADPDIPVIALTALDHAAAREQCAQAGMNEFVGKPVTAGQLIAAVDRCLGGAGPSVARRGRRGVTRVVARGSGRQSVRQSLEEWNPGFMDSVIDQFLGEVQGEIRGLEEALAQGDTARLGDIGHRLRGAADVMDAATLSHRALALEKAGLAGDLPSAARLTPELIGELQKLTAALSEG